MTGVTRYQDLRVYRLCDRLRKLVRPLLARPEFSRDLNLRDQLRRAVEKPCPNIAEGFLRFNPRENAQFVRVAKSSVGEVVVHMERALAAELVTEAESGRVIDVAIQALKSLTKYVIYLEHAEVPGTPPPGSSKAPRRTRWRGSEPEPEPEPGTGTGTGTGTEPEQNEPGTRN